MSCQFDKRIKPREEEHKNRNIMSGKLLVDELEANADALESQRALEEKRRREILMKKLNRTRSKSKKVEEKKDDSDGKSVMEKSLDEMTAMDSAMKAQNARRQAKLERIMTERREKLKKSRTLEKLEQENKRLFSLLDTEGDGAVDVKELAVFLKSIKANASASIIMSAVDTNNSGKMEYNEFIELMHSVDATDDDTDPLEKGSDEMLEMFEIMDENMDGLLTEEEIIAALGVLNPDVPESKCKEWVKDYDKDDDSKLDYKEFCRLFNSTGLE